MKYFNLFLISILVITLTSCSSSDDNSTGNVAGLSIEERLQNIIDERVGEDKLIGVSVSVRVDSEELWKLVGGNSKLNVPIESDMRFGIASITKTVVAATTMKLIDEGVLSLDDTIGDWLILNNQNINESVTIFQLLNHFTGINDYFAGPGLWQTVEANLDVALTPTEVSEYIGTPINTPGVTHEYSNSNYLILGMIIEASTSQTLGQVMREKLWTPLGLDNIYFGANEPVQGTMATPWRDTDGDGTLEDIADQYGPAYHSVFYGAADVFSTASSLSLWASNLYGGNVLTEESKQQMLTSYFDIPHPTFIGYGLGVRKNIYAGRVMWGHTGGMRGYGSHMFWDPVSNLSIAILNNQSRSANGPTLRHELIEALLNEIFQEL